MMKLWRPLPQAGIAQTGRQTVHLLLRAELQRTAALPLLQLQLLLQRLLLPAWQRLIRRPPCMRLPLVLQLRLLLGPARQLRRCWRLAEHSTVAMGWCGRRHAWLQECWRARRRLRRMQVARCQQLPELSNHVTSVCP